MTEPTVGPRVGAGAGSTAIAPELAAPPGTEAGERGRLEISDAVVRKIVERAADAVPGSVRGSRRVAGVALGETSASAKVVVGPDIVDIALDLILRYPEPIPALVEQIRERVVTEVARITGHRVRECEVTVSQLRREHTASRVL